MKYVLLVQLPAGGPPPDGPPTDLMQRYADLKQELIDEGLWLGGEALQPASITTRVQVRDDETLIVDGPLAETSEQIAGYYLLDCRDLDEAIAVAARVPGARDGTVEVRPVFEYEQLLNGADG